MWRVDPKNNAVVECPAARPVCLEHSENRIP